jgi:HK97 family phage prohead protease
MTSRTRKPAPEDEQRYWASTLEVRSSGGQRTIAGLGVPYNRQSALLPGGFYEVVETRALAKTLGDNLNVTCLLEHHPEWLLASTDSGSMRLDDDPAIGLSFEADLPRTQAGNDTHELISTRRISGASIGFQTFSDSFQRVGAGVVRHLESIRLAHIAPTAQPAYPQTHVAVRSLAQQLGEDVNDVMALANKGELRSLFTRTDQMVSATPTVEPGIPVESRSDGALDLARRRLLLMKRKMDWDAPPSDDPGYRLLELYRRKLNFDQPGLESRSCDRTTVTTARGHLRAVDVGQVAWDHGGDW